MTFFTTETYLWK